MKRIDRKIRHSKMGDPKRENSRYRINRYPYPRLSSYNDFLMQCIEIHSEILDHLLPPEKAAKP